MVVCGVLYTAIDSVQGVQIHILIVSSGVE